MNTIRLLILFAIIWHQTLWSNSSEGIASRMIVHITDNNEPKDLAIPYVQSYQRLTQSLNCWLLKFSAPISDSLLSTIRLHPLVISASIDHTLQLRNTRPNDTFFSLQLQSLYNVTPPNSIPYGNNAIAAWDYSNTATTVLGDTIVVAIIDEGFDIYHEDLDYWYNYREIPNDSIDNDHNGYIDDCRGYNITANSGKLNQYGAAHGTAVAGGAAAHGNNQIGVAGVVWNVRILPIALDLNTGGISDLIRAYDYVVTMRKKYHQTNGKEGCYVVVANFSGGKEGSSAAEEPIWCSMYDTLAHYNIITTIATANSLDNAVSLGDMPTLCPSDYMIAVTALSQTLDVDGSDYDTGYVDLAAQHYYYCTKTPNYYGYTGTGASFAAPLVAGTIALMYCNMDSNSLVQMNTFAPTQLNNIKNSLFNGVDITDPLKTKVKSKGKLNVAKAIKNIIQYNITPRGNLQLQQDLLTDNIYTFQKKLYIIKNNPNPIDIAIYDLQGRRVANFSHITESSTLELRLENGLYILQHTTNGQVIETNKIDIY